MSASLVGSEMCIRDSLRPEPEHQRELASTRRVARSPRTGRSRTAAEGPVSYTHLTLPTICSV
eukprot:5905422-Alexandrium_andersonii.AAC.1